MTISKIDWALHYAGKGLKVFPVHANSKSPIHDSWPDLATSDPAPVTEWWQEWPDANIGATPGASGHIVIDVDLKKIDGNASLRELEAAYGNLPYTMETTTPTGGRHLWLSLDGSCRNSAGALAAGIDTRGVRGFVVMGGSEIDGVAYHTDETPIAEAPAGWAAPLAALGARAENRDASGAELDLPGNIERAQSHVSRAISAGDVAIEGSGGNDRTYRLASALRDFGLTRETALAVAEPWNAACLPPWSEEEIDTVFLNAYNYAQNEAGAKAFADPSGKGFASVPVSSSPIPETGRGNGQEARPNRFSPLSIGEMAGLPDPSWLIEGWLPHYELSMMYGAYGSVKSFAALDIALSVAAGLPALGLEGEQRAFPVLYIAGEGQIGIAKQRVPAWLEHHGVSSDDLPFHLIREMPLARNGDADLALMFQGIEAVCGNALPRLVVFDTHARAMAGLDENAVQDTARTVEFYEKVLRRYSCAGLAIHHSGVDGSRERGSTALGGACSTILHMEYDMGGKTATLSCTKMKDAEPPAAIHFHPTKVGASIVLTRKEWTAEAHQAARPELYGDVVRALTANGAYSLADALTSNALASEMPGVIDEEDQDAQEKAKRKMVQILERNARKLLRPLIHGDEKPLQWRLPGPPKS